MFENLKGQKGFSIDRLATLCHIAEAGSISAATGDNATQQSQYSRQIIELESFLGVDLLDRHSRPHKLNDAGRELSRICQNYLSVLDEFVGGWKGQRSRIVVGAGESQIEWLLIPGILPKLRSALPGTSIIFQNRRTDAIIEELIGGEIDLGLVRKNALRGNLEALGDWPLEYRFFIPKKFRAKLETPVTMAQIARYPMAIMEGRGEFRSTLTHVAEEAGVELNLDTECSSSTQMALLVARKECCAVLPSFATSVLDGNSIDNFAVEGFEDLRRTLCIAYNPKRVELRPIVEKAARIMAGYAAD